MSGGIWRISGQKCFILELQHLLFIGAKHPSGGGGGICMII